MASQSLYRKWRSQTFSEIIGQEHVVQTLRNALAEGRIAHAYLFTGPRGVGKTSMARLLAKAVNCTASDVEPPCGACPSCVSIAEGRAVDVIEIDAASHTSVDDAREIIERVQFRPASGRYKVYIIDEVHMLSTAAFNALLKTLEEPPEHALFIMATTEVHKIPATILSRCQRFTFTRHTIAATAAHISQIAEAEQMRLEPGAAEGIARSATGSMRDALGVLEQLAAFADGAITLEQVQSLLGMTAATEVNALVEALLNGDIGAALQAVNGVADQGADVRQFTRDLVDRLRSLMLLVATNDRALLDVGDDDLAILEAWAALADAGTLVHWIKVFSGLDYQLRTSPYGHLPLELATVEALVAPAPVGAVPRPAAPGRAGPAQTTPPKPQLPKPTPAKPAKPVKPQTPPPTAGAVAAIEGSATEPVAQAAPEPVTEPAPEPVAAIDLPAVEQQTVLAPVAAPSDALNEAMPADATDGVIHEDVAAANADISLLEQVESAWPDVVRDVRPQSPTVQALLKGTRPLDVEGNIVVLIADSKFHRSKLEETQNRRIVEEILSKHIGTDIGIRCTTEEKGEAQDLRGQIREARKDRWVKAAANIFDADVVSVESDGADG